MWLLVYTHSCIYFGIMFVKVFLGNAALLGIPLFQWHVSLSPWSSLQVPSRFIYYLLKKYLHVNSLIKDYDSLSTTATVAAGDDETLQRLQDFEVFDAQFNLLTELFFVFNWFEGTLLEEYQKSIQRALKGVSIFTGTMPTAEALAPRRKKKKVYKTRVDFDSDDKYGNYVKNTLRQGMRVRVSSLSLSDFLPPTSTI